MNLIEIYEVIQVCLSIYILYYIIRERIEWGIVVLYVFITILFTGLKLHIIPYELGGTLDGFLWGTYNVLYSLFVLFLLIDGKYDGDYGSIGKRV